MNRRTCVCDRACRAQLLKFWSICSMYRYSSMYTRVCMYVCMVVCTYMYVSMYVYVCMHVAWSTCRNKQATGTRKFWSTKVRLCCGTNHNKTLLQTHGTRLHTGPGKLLGGRTPPQEHTIETWALKGGGIVTLNSASNSKALLQHTSRPIFPPCNTTWLLLLQQQGN